jgi:TPR repeat protein
VRAVTLYDQACTGGALLGCSHLGEAYERGFGVTRDVSRAASLFAQSCETEMAGCFHLADLHTRGEGVAQDYEKAIELFEQACSGTLDQDEGSPPIGESCFRVGDLYATGAGVDRDLSRASLFFRRACQRGYAEACRR